MVIILADKEGRQVKILDRVEFDAELNDGNRDFELVTWAEDSMKIKDGYRVFIPDTEIGGIVGEMTVVTSSESVKWKGYTWRGLLGKKVIVPPPGQDYYTISGELNAVLKQLVEPAFGGVFKVPQIDTKVSVTNYKFDRFCTMLDGITKMLKSVNYRLDIKYNQGKANGTGWADVSAVPIKDLSKQIEFSQDSKLNFTATKKTNGVNHLIVGGKGELQNRNILHLYVQQDGSIGKTQYYKEIDEIAEFYENTSTDTADLESTSIKHFKKIMNRKTLEMDVEKLGIDVSIGDIVGGRDYMTGMSMKKPLGNIIVTVKSGKVSKIYKLEGE